MELLLQGFAAALSFQILPLLILAVAGGIVMGAMPGLTATMGVAVLLPFTFGMDSSAALIMLVGVYIGAIYGGSIAAILLKTPGTPAAAATVLDGNALVMQGKAAKALSISAIASFTGGIVSTIMLITISPILARFALRFGAPEYFGLAVFGLTIIASVSAKNLTKGMLAGLFGLFVASVGLDPVTSYPRFTFDSVALLNGFAIIPVLIGLFAVSEALVQIETVLDKGKQLEVPVDRQMVSRKEMIRLLPTTLKSAVMGTFIGSIPGAGADIAAFVSYNEAKRASKSKELFGKGALEGIAAPEAGNNGVTGGALVPLLTLGVPGDAVAAILLGALMIQGLQPGPLLFQKTPEIVYGLFSAMILANIAMLIIGLLGIRIFSRVIDIPRTLVIPIIISLSVVGAFSMNNAIFDVYVALGFGLIGYFMKKAEIPVSPIVLAIILGPMAETNLRKAVLMYRGSWSFLYTRPITVVFLVLSVVSVISITRLKKKTEV